MLEDVTFAVVQALEKIGVNAVAAFDGSELDEDKAFVCVGVDSAHITSAGLGGYIGICTENGEVREMYGDRAEITLVLNVYAPPSENEKISELAGLVRSALPAVPSLAVAEFSLGGVSYDEPTRMLLGKCAAKCSAYLVRRKTGRKLSDYELEGSE